MTAVAASFHVGPGEVHPYGGGRVGERIAAVLAEAPPGERVLHKSTFPLGETVGLLASVQSQPCDAPARNV